MYGIANTVCPCPAQESIVLGHCEGGNNHK